MATKIKKKIVETDDWTSIQGVSIRRPTPIVQQKNKYCMHYPHLQL